MPPQAMVMIFGAPLESYVPTHHTGVGNISVLAPNDFFIFNLLALGIDIPFLGF